MCFPCSRCLKNSRDDNLFGKIAVFMQEWEAVGSGGISLGAFRQKFVLYLMKILLGMKRVVSLVCMMACLFVGCDKAVIQVVEFTVASDVRMKVGRSENLFDVMFLYKEDPEQEKWYFLPVGDVKDFTFERGYEYRVRARVDKEPTTYSVTKIISKTQKVSEGMGSDDVYIVQMLVHDAFVFVQHLHEFGNAAFVVECFRTQTGFFPFIRQGDPHTAIQKCQFPQTLCQRIPFVDGRFLKNFRIRMECDFGPFVIHGREFPQLTAGDTPFKTDIVGHPVAVDFHFHPIGKCVDAGDPHAVKTAGNFVGVMVKFTTGMKHGHDHFHSRDPQILVNIHRHTASVVLHSDAVIVMNGDFHFGGIPRQCFVDTVVHHFVHQVMQSAGTGIADVHGGTHPDGLQPFQHSDLTGGIRSGYRSIFTACGGGNKVFAHKKIFPSVAAAPEGLQPV